MGFNPSFSVCVRHHTIEKPFAEATGITIIIKGKISRIHRFFIALNSFGGIFLPK